MSSRLRRLLDVPERLLLVTLMVTGCMALWVAIPVGWLWIGSQIEASSDLSTGLAVTMAGSIASIIVTVLALVRLNRRHMELRERRDRGGRTSVLELLLVTSAGVAVIGFGIWFLLFAGTSPAPLNISY